MWKKIALFIGLLTFLTIVWASWEPLLIRYWPSAHHDDLPSRGQFGDSYGGLNTLFTGWAFAGVGFTIYLQIVENKAREEERREQEVERGKREADRIVEKFEDRFFRLTDVLRSHVHSLNFANHTGKAGFSMIVEEQSIDQLDRDSTIAGALRRYEREYAGYKNTLGPYFRILYRIVKYVDQSAVADKESYTGIVRAELGNAELWLLALNCLTPYGEKFKPLVEKYHMLKHFAARGRLWNGVEASIRAAYPPTAFHD